VAGERSRRLSDIGDSVNPRPVDAAVGGLLMFPILSAILRITIRERTSKPWSIGTRIAKDLPSSRLTEHSTDMSGRSLHYTRGGTVPGKLNCLSGEGGGRDEPVILAILPMVAQPILNSDQTRSASIFLY